MTTLLDVLVHLPILLGLIGHDIDLASHGSLEKVVRTIFGRSGSLRTLLFNVIVEGVIDLVATPALRLENAQ
jgi:hypothetical protein